MRKLLFTLFALTSFLLGAETISTTTSGIFTDGIWSPTENFQDGDTLIINHPVDINGHLDYESINLTIVVNDIIFFGDPSFLILGSESTIIWNNSPFVDNTNTNDKIKIGTFIYSEGEIASAIPGQIFTEGGITLPVELIEFDINKTNYGTIKLNWSTATEINNDFFLIEKSIDGKNWNIVGRVDGNGTTNEIKYYTFVDTEAEYYSYYKLKQYDYDGKSDVLTMFFLTHPAVITAKADTRNVQGINIPSYENVLSINYFDFNGKQLKNNNLTKNYILIISTNRKIYKKKFTIN